MTGLSWPILLFASCVVRYGDPPEPLPAEPLPPPVDFAEVESRLAELLAQDEDRDRLDRIRAAQELARRMKTQDPRAQQVALAYLQRLVAIEERSRPVEAPALYGEEVEQGFTPLVGAGIQEEDLGGPEELAPQPAVGSREGEGLEAPPVGAPVEDGAEDAEDEGDDTGEPTGDAGLDEAGSERLGRARWLLDDGDALGAMTVLEECRGAPCWDEAAALHAEARDAHVARIREEAGARFVAARAEADPEARRAGLEEVRGTLAALADRYPNSPLTPDVRRNLALVQREIEAEAGE